ncbi:Paired radical SAM protein 1 [uncultured delta proteobacterium]|uniref:Paired radical SAM protein 1 n=1 Tax=uncultured delta proteobacterium TaxID=34034 RepID=A0A212KFR3_9DELT|nr:Paired radical SAM protein 1 [uncultured delta proteobacterium]
MKLPYRLLPFRYKPLGEKILLVNETGEYHAVTPEEWQRIVAGRLVPDEDIFHDLTAKDFICSGYSPARINRIAAKYRTRKKYLFESTALHMFVVTHRCNQSCAYCHASSIESLARSPREDMPPEVARKGVERAFESPSPYLKFEFQGGEPTLNFETVEAIVRHAELLNVSAGKRIEFVICTNLHSLQERHLDFYREHGIHVSTSLDGPEALHDACRKTLSGEGTYRAATNAMKRVKSALGDDTLSALLTVTKHSIGALRDVINEYIASGFRSIFIRRLNMIGMAQQQGKNLHYADDQFLDAYVDALEYIIALNKQGCFFVEEFAAILLRKILTPFGSGFVDMQSPAGTGLSAVIYDVDGGVFVSDEARMLHRATGNADFRLGNACDKTRNELFAAPILKRLMEDSALECLPGCAWCAYLPYCGSDPVRNFSLHGRLVSPKSHDPWCGFYKRTFDYLFGLLLSGDEEIASILWSWATGLKPDTPGQAAI